MIARIVRWGPLLLTFVLMGYFAISAPRFLSPDNLVAILTQSSGLILLVIGLNLVLLSAGVDLSVGAVMYVSAVMISIGAMPGASSPLALLLFVIIAGSAAGLVNGYLVVACRVPAFVATLAFAFIVRAVALLLSSTRMVLAPAAITDWGRSHVLGVPAPLLLTAVASLIIFGLYGRTPLGVYLRAIGADAEGARRSGIPADAARYCAYVLCGALAGLAGFVSLSQASAASVGFGQNVEFLAIAAAVLGGTSLFGGRGNFWGPILGALLVTMVQNGLSFADANPYAYPVITGAIILLAAVLDSARARVAERAGRRVTLRPAGAECAP